MKKESENLNQEAARQKIKYYKENIRRLCNSDESL